MEGLYEGAPLFRDLGVRLRDSLCDVALFMPYGYYASASSLAFLDLAKNRRSLLQQCPKIFNQEQE